MKRIVGYRKMLGMTQKDMANEFGISKQSYWMKENGQVQFSDKEKIKFKNMLIPMFPDITIDAIFFS